MQSCKQTGNNNNIETFDTVVIGAGAAGLFYAAGDRFVPNSKSLPSGDKFDHSRKLILEKTGHPGQKLLMSGNGMCNITHGGSIKEFTDKYGDNGRLIRRCLYRHSNIELISAMQTLGVPLAERSDGKVFPASMKAKDVLDALISAASSAGWQIRCDLGAEEIRMPEKDVKCSLISIRLSDGSVIKTKKLVIATGGSSYPSTGSDGSFFDVLRRDLSLNIVQPRPALAPVFVQNYKYAGLSGISFDDVTITTVPQVSNDDASEANAQRAAIGDSSEAAAQRAAKKTSDSIDKKPHTVRGQLLLTHRGFSGPAALHISQYVKAGSVIRINYLPEINREQFRETVKKDRPGCSTGVANYLASRFGLPKAFAAIKCDEPTKRLSQLTNKELNRLADSLTCCEYSVSGTGGWNDAMVTAGGVSLDQMDLKTMRVKILRSLSRGHSDTIASEDHCQDQLPFSPDIKIAREESCVDQLPFSPDIRIIGEALDVNGDTGGYNLQFAYSSAMSALDQDT